MENKEIAESNFEKLSSVELVKRLSESSPEEASAYSLEIVRRFEPILRFSWRRVKDFIEYPDFVQDVFVRLFSHLPNVVDPEALPGYFGKVASSVANNHLRKRSSSPLARTRDLSPREFDSLINSVDEDLSTGIFLQSYFDQLSERERYILTREAFYGYSLKEIADMLHLEPSAVRVSKYRALSKLRALMRKDAVGDAND